jgi:hypothetical protein
MCRIREFVSGSILPNPLFHIHRSGDPGRFVLEVDAQKFGHPFSDLGIVDCPGEAV